MADDPRAALMAALKAVVARAAGLGYQGGRDGASEELLSMVLHGWLAAESHVDPPFSRVLAAVDAIEAEARKPDPAALDAFRLISNLHDRTLLTMQAAWIEWKHGDGAHAAMENWIEEALDGPGLVPDPADEDSVWSEDASEYFRLNHQPAERSPDA